MHYLAYISFIFIFMQLFNALLNFIFRERIRNTDNTCNEHISVLIPARNEEKNIGHLLANLQALQKTGTEIIVFDDQSDDNTVEIIKKVTEPDREIHLIQSDGLPAGWLGKNHACYKLAQQAKGDYFLFIDADVRLYETIIHDTVAYLKKHHLGLVSVFPVQIQKTIGEKASVPVMNYILLTLLPLIFVRTSPFVSHSAANGQFMLFDAKVYKKLQPHRTFKSSPVEDIAISRYYKKEKIKIACLTGESRIKCRMYNNYQEALNGFSKNVFMFFGNKPVLAFLFWIFCSLGFIPVIYTVQNYMFIYPGIIILLQILVSVTSRQNPVYNILLFPVQLMFLLHIMVKSLIIKKNKKYSWKNRSVYS